MALTLAHYSITRNWVAAMDFWLEQDNNTRVTGNYALADGGAAAAANNSGTSGHLYVAPALEYNFGGNVGVIFGAGIFAWGRNETALVTPVIAINTVY